MTSDFDSMLSFAPPAEKVADDDSSVKRLREAKAFSDSGDMVSKNRVLTALVQADPAAFKVDSPNEKFPGLTHVPSNFKIHAHPAVAAQVAPEPSLIDMLDLNNSLASDEEARYKLGAEAPAVKPKKELPYRDRADMFAIDKDGNVFGGLHPNGAFGVFGGGIDPGEDAVAAAAREFQEESGWTVTNARALPFKPHTVDWKPPYKSKKQEARSKQFRGSRTYFVVGDLGEKIPKAKIDEVGRKGVRPYTIDEAIALTEKEGVTDPELVASNKKRKAILEHIRAMRTPPVEKVAHYRKLCSKCDKVIASCRCTGPAKDIEYGLCRDCGGDGDGWDKKADLLPGGAGDDKPDADFDRKELAEGTEHETEHTTDKAIAREIAKDHLTEDSHYYEKEAAAPVTVAIDFDGTLSKKQTPFNPKTAGKPRKAIVRLARMLKDKGCRIIVWTVRDNDRLVRKWCKKYGAPCDHINENPDQPPDSSGKIYADVYLDDKAVNAEDASAAITAVLDRVGPLLAERESPHA